MLAPTSIQDPREAGHKPPFPEQDQPHPGLEARMTPAPDYGETSYQGTGRLEGRAALITGADSGIGRAVALAFAREGADVLISYLDSDTDAAETARVVRDAGRKAVVVPGDVQREQHCQDLIDRAVDEFGHLDLLVNNAAYQMTHDSMQEISAEEWERVIRTNITATFYLSKAALPVLRPGGSIINTASIQAYQPSASLIHYASSKAAIVNFSKALAEEAMKSGVRVNVVAPGPVWTPLIVSTMPAEQYTEFGGQTPIGRPAQPIEVATSYVFLASNDARFISGQVLGVTGGSPLY